MILQTSRHDARVVRVPFDPAAPRSTVFRFHAPVGLQTADLAASADLLAVGVVSEQRNSLETTGQEFTGPPLGPLTALGPPTGRWMPFWHEIEGDRVITTEWRDVSTSRWVVHEPGVAPRTVTAAQGAEIAGDLVARLKGRTLTIRNWRTGAPVTRYRTPPEIPGFDMRADGAVVFTQLGGDVFESLPGASPRRIARNAGFAMFAGDRIVFPREVRRTGYARLQVRDPDGRVRPLGVPTATLSTFEVDDQRVLWQANGCLLTTLLTDPSARAAEAGVCPRSEIALPDEVSRPVGSARRVLIRADCVSAAPPGCRGTVTLRDTFEGVLTKRQQFRIPVGRRGRVKVRLTRRGYAIAKRMDRQIGGASVEVRTVSVDPDGRRRVQLHHFVVDVLPKGIRSS